MNTWLAVATVLAVLTGLVHSVFGEILIFRRLPRDSSGQPLQWRPLGVLWATWHIATVLGWALAAVLWQLALATEPSALREFTLNAVAAAYGVSGLLVLIGTRGRHPGWAALGAVAVLILLA